MEVITFSTVVVFFFFIRCVTHLNETVHVLLMLLLEFLLQTLHLIIPLKETDYAFLVFFPFSFLQCFKKVLVHAHDLGS